MKRNGSDKWIRISLVLAGLALCAVLIVPVWKIDLDAPQYPEGLRLLIYANGLGGDVDIINGLNHYIGMKTLHSSDFIEFTILPYIVVFFALFFILTGILGKRVLINILLVLFVLFGVVSMIDFWQWEYNYGHNLDPNAAIIVPGMAYQPPLIGFKQLLNFGAYSFPDVGAWIFIGAGLILAVAFIKQFKKRKIKSRKTNFAVPVAAALMWVFASCSAQPEPIKLGSDACHYCKMTISDARFGAEILTTKGKVYKFDDPHCIIAFLDKDQIDRQLVKDIYLVDFNEPHELLNVNQSYLLESESFNSPMNGNIAAFISRESAKEAIEKLHPREVRWDDLLKEKQ